MIRPSSIFRLGD